MTIGKSQFDIKGSTDSANMETNASANSIAAPQIQNLQISHSSRQARARRNGQARYAQTAAQAAGEILTEKHCGHCKRTLPLTEFYKRSAATIGGRQAWCRDCMLEAMRRHRADRAAKAAAVPMNEVLAAASGANLDLQFFDIADLVPDFGGSQ